MKHFDWLIANSFFRPAEHTCKCFFLHQTGRRYFGKKQTARRKLFIMSLVFLGRSAQFSKFSKFSKFSSLKSAEFKARPRHWSHRVEREWKKSIFFICKLQTFSYSSPLITFLGWNLAKDFFFFCFHYRFSIVLRSGALAGRVVEFMRPSWRWALMLFAQRSHCQLEKWLHYYQTYFRSIEWKVSKTSGFNSAFTAESDRCHRWLWECAVF